MTLIKVSIIIPVYNQPELVIRAIKSVPVRDDIEVIVIDDCSTDNTYDVLKSLEHIRLFKNKVNSGAGITRNVGIDNATGEYIVFLDSDDYFDTAFFNDIIDNLQTDVVFYDLIINSGQRWASVSNGRLYLPYGAVKFIRKDILGEVRFPKVRISEDALFWEDLLKKNPTISHIAVPLLHYNYPRPGSNDWKREHNTWDSEALNEFREYIKDRDYSYNVKAVLK